MIAADENRPLFAIGDARSMADLQTEFGVRRLVNELSAKTFEECTDDQLVETVVSELQVEPLHIDALNRTLISAREVAVSPDGRHYDELQYAANTYSDGAIARFEVPYRGAAELWNWKPYPEWDVVPHGNIVQDGPDRGTLQIVLLASGGELKTKFNAALDEELAAVQSCIEAQTPFVRQANQALRSRAGDEVTARRGRLDFLASIAPRQVSTTAVDSETTVRPAPIRFPQRTTQSFEAINAEQFDTGADPQHRPSVSAVSRCRAGSP